MELTGSSFHHLCRVRRAAAGDRLVAMSRTGGGTFRVRLLTVEHERCTLLVEECLGTGPVGAPGAEGAPDTGMNGVSGRPPLSVYMAPLKGKRSDAVVRQLTELGVDEIAFVNTERTVARIDQKSWSHRRERLEKIITEAVEQSGRGSFPRLLPPEDFSALPADGIVFHEVPVSDRPLESVLEESAGAVRILTGPEGGFSNREIEDLVSRGWKAVTMPLPVLRAETAALAAASLVLYTMNYYSVTNGFDHDG